MTPVYAIDKTLTLGDLRFHYRDWDGQGWPVLLLHGLASTSHIWDLVAPLLVESARVIAPDLRGHGQSDKPDGDYSFQTIGGDVRRMLSALDMKRPVVVGHSWGARVGLWLAVHHPDQVAGLIMLDGGIIDLGVMSWEETRQRLSPPHLDGRTVDEFRETIREKSPQGLITPVVEAAILANFEIDIENRIHPRLPRAYHMRILRAMWEQRLVELYERVACPVLILPTRREGKDAPPLLARKELCVRLAGERIADVEIVWLEDTIHDAPLQRPHAVAAYIRRFLSERVVLEEEE